MPSQASSLLSAKLRCHFSGLPSHFEADFSEFSALPGHSNHAFHSRGSSFLRFSLFSLHIASCLFLWRLFGRFPGPLGTSRRAPGSHFSGQKGRVRKTPPPFFGRTCVEVRFRSPNWCLRRCETTPKPPKSKPKCASKASDLGSIDVLHCPSSVLLFNNVVLHSKYYKISTKH